MACSQARVEDDTNSQHPLGNRFDGAADGLGDRLCPLGDVVVYVLAQLGQELGAIALAAVVVFKLGNGWCRQFGQTGINQLKLTLGQNSGFTLNGQRLTLGKLCPGIFKRKLQLGDNIFGPHVPVFGHVFNGPHRHIVDQAFAVQFTGKLDHLPLLRVRVKVEVVKLVDSFGDGLQRPPAASRASNLAPFY